MRGIVRRLLAERGTLPANPSKVRRVSFVVINAVTVSDESRDEFEERFARRAGTVSEAAGFEAFELLKPLGDGRYLVYTRWATEDDFLAWMRSGQFSEAHARHAERPPTNAESEVWRFEVLEGEYAG
jgi:heme oxygenase (mycobilin-producing)